MNPPSSIRLIHATAPTPGAIAILQLAGEGCEAVLHRITNVMDWPIGRMRLVDLAGIDEGLALMLSSDIAQIMPHGGLRVVQRLTAKLTELGVMVSDASEVDPQHLYPEAVDKVEALTMLALSRAASPLAIDLLLAQPQRWRALQESGATLSDADLARSKRLNRLIDPPIVVLAGRPNVGKSTLSNALLGRAMSIAADVPGTTRDYVAGRIDLGGIVVDWHDTPGLRSDADAMESRAIEIARNLMNRADLLISMRDADHEWPALPRAADVFVVNKVDSLPTTVDAPAADNESQPARISARNGNGLASLVSLLRDQLIPASDLSQAGPWLFDARLLESN